MTNPERCSCGAREKNKCSKESEHKTGKMCLKDYIPIPQELFDRMEEIMKKSEENRLKDGDNDTSQGGYTSCGACNGYGCDRCMPQDYLEEEL